MIKLNFINVIKADKFVT